MRCGEIANARNAVFFNGTGGSEAGKSRSAERRLRDGLGSFSDHSRNRPSIGIRVFTCFLKISWQVQHFVNLQVQHFVYLHVQISWQAQHFVNLHVQISWQVQHFVYLHVQISWQAQHFGNLHVQISWQAQYKMRCGEIANARNAVFFNGTGGSEAGKSRSAERRLRDGLGSFSDHSRNRPSIGIRVFTCFLK